MGEKFANAVTSILTFIIAVIGTITNIMPDYWQGVFAGIAFYCTVWCLFDRGD